MSTAMMTNARDILMTNFFITDLLPIYKNWLATCRMGKFFAHAVFILRRNPLRNCRHNHSIPCAGKNLHEQTCDTSRRANPRRRKPNHVLTDCNEYNRHACPNPFHPVSDVPKTASAKYRVLAFSLANGFVRIHARRP